MKKMVLLFVLILSPAFAQDFSGTFIQQDDPTTVITLQSHAEGYTGTLLNEGSDEFAIEALLQEGYLAGYILGAAIGYDDFFILAELLGDTLNVLVAPIDELGNPIESAAEAYTFVRDSEVATGSPSPNVPTAPTPTAPESPVIAKGLYADLTEDNALAVYEAYIFSLQQLGYTETFTEADKQAFFEFAVREYPHADQETQLILQRAREVWTQVQANWEGATLEAQRGFILAVIELIHGEEAVQQALGKNQAASGTDAGRVRLLNEMGCSTVDSCMSHLNPEGYNDMVNAQGCWSGAGCESYDAETNTFYEEPSYDFDYSAPSFEDGG